jgi:hypothetical protein
MPLSRTRAVVAFCGVALLAPGLATAQAARPSAADSKWEVEFHVGYGKAGDPKRGVSQLPPAGETFTASVGSGRFVRPGFWQMVPPASMPTMRLTCSQAASCRLTRR